MRQTSIDAYRTIKENGLLKNLQLRVYEYLVNNGPSTGKEVLIALASPDENSGAITTRLSELRNKGVVKEAGTTKCKITGREVIVWEATDSLPQKVQRKKTTKQKLLNAENFIKENGLWEQYIECNKSSN